MEEEDKEEGREEEGRRGKIELLIESFLLADQGQGQTQLLFIKRRVLPCRTPCCGRPGL